MSESATDKRIRELARQLENEKRDHARTKNEKQRVIESVWRLVPGGYISLMGVFPPLRKLLHVLGEAADLQDPSKGLDYENTMRTEYTPDGETLTKTERAVFTHRKHRADVTEMNKRLHQVADDLGHLIAGAAAEYNPPAGVCSECGRPIFQTPVGRSRSYCSAKCRQRASRNVTKPDSSVDA